MIAISERLKYLLIIIGFLITATIVYVITSSENVVGGIVYNRVGDELKYLVVTTRNSKSWIFPKGKVKYYELKTHAVLREVVEEAGVNANLNFKLDGNPYIYRKPSGKRQSMELYAVEYLSETQIWREKNERNRKWVMFNEAKNMLGPELVRALDEVNTKLIKY